jgi:hypothetical protein
MIEKLVRSALTVVAVLAVAQVHAEEDAWAYQLYLDVGYAGSNREPSDGAWRSKGTTAVLNEAKVFLAMGDVRKVASTDSRWGLDFGLQFGNDADAQQPLPEDSVSNSDVWYHLYRANVSYLLGDEGEVELTSGIFNSHIGYESYLAIENPNYTRGYLLDYVPYFMLGVAADWEVSERTNLALYLTTGFNYLDNPNDIPALSFRGDWQLTNEFTFIQNLYYGADQEETDIEYWRFFSDSIVEWKKGPWLVAAALDYGSEKQADVVGQPRYEWSAGALWLRYALNPRNSLSLRPEFYQDSDGAQTGVRQTIRALTGTYKYRFPVKTGDLVGSVELRYDKSTGEEGGFYDEPDDRLVPTQTILLFSINWNFKD